MLRFLSLWLLLAAPTVTTAFQQPAVGVTSHRSLSQHTSSTLFMSESTKNNEYLQGLSQQNPDMGADPLRNPDRPELPVVPGDYDWDAKYQGDADWTTENIPGRGALNEIELAQQVTALGGLEEKWKKERVWDEYEESINVGFVPTAEVTNGRFAMFFLVTGLLTEYWTGFSIPAQIEEMLRIAGVIGFDG